MMSTNPKEAIPDMNQKFVCNLQPTRQGKEKKGFRELPAVSEAHIKKGNISLSLSLYF